MTDAAKIIEFIEGLDHTNPDFDGKVELLPWEKKFIQQRRE